MDFIAPPSQRGQKKCMPGFFIHAKSALFHFMQLQQQCLLHLPHCRILAGDEEYATLQRQHLTLSLDELLFLPPFEL